MNDNQTDKGELGALQSFRLIPRLNPLSVISEQVSNGNSGSQAYYQGFDNNSDMLVGIRLKN